jgi:AcrR family transcriptional regulator
MPRHRFKNTRDRIERAAIQLFVERGVGETAVRDIARAVGVSEGALYRHFASKEELVWTLFERPYVAFGHQLKTRADRERTARAKVAAIIQEFCRAHDENPTVFRFLLFVQHGQSGKLGLDVLTPDQVMSDVLADAIASGELPDQSPGLATAVVFGVVLEPARFAACGQLPVGMMTLADRLAAAAWAAVTTV